MPLKLKSVSLSKGYYYGDYLQHKPGLEYEVTGDMTPEEALDEVEKLLDAWHEKKVSQQELPPSKYVPVLDKAEQKLKDNIEDCIIAATTIKELNQVKTAAEAYNLIPQFNKKREELTNGQ